jgi:hypothetical protein
MTLHAAGWLDTGSYNALEDRMAGASMLGSELGTFAGGVGATDPGHGVVSTADCAVTANGTPNLTVNIALGKGFIRGTQAVTQGVYHFVNDATLNLTGVPAGDATNPTWHLVIIQVRDAGGGYGGSSNDCRAVLVTGTPAASPADPSLAAYPNALVIARIVMPAASSNVGGGGGQGTITDLRTLAGFAGKVPVFATTTDRDRFIPTPSVGQCCYVTADGCIYEYETISAVSAWRRLASSVPHSNTIYRIISNGTTWTNPNGYADYNATDKAAMTLSFTKHRADTKLVIEMSGTFQLTSGVQQNLALGISIGGTDYSIAPVNVPAVVARYPASGNREITGLAAGSYTIFPRFNGGGAVIVNTYANDDNLTYSVTETL